MSKSYSANDVIKIILKNIILIVVLAVIGTAGLGMYAKHKQTTTYTADREIMIGHNLNKVNYKNSQVLADLGMMQTYANLIQDRQVLSEARKELPKKLQKRYSVSDLESAVDAKPRAGEIILDIHAKVGSAKDAALIVNAVTDATKQELPKIKAGIGQIQPLSKAYASDVKSQTSPSAKKYAILGFALGALAGMVIAFVRTTFKHLVK
ncbi:lipopolysaccharide biosynthesis protein [Limosilactobacillus fermentum]|uniref:YveK family protein n=1 Tax=Limosilactobacillus fermentum TaxID=1613 RepID=UPI0005A093AC|nr:Wzz/FepE/Etk N-terminal domain-containing protein [Limosilactobacillus fermentum]OWP36060.1 lipopolysaccharide biosynthesis protein [Limosilactobacillus fermentum]UTF47134.1 Wzz/FepE/Etk N-terminal domain-containing protein [Limosilactobacillus fermentum]